MGLFDTPRSTALGSFHAPTPEPPIVERNNYSLKQLPELEELGWNKGELGGATVYLPDAGFAPEDRAASESRAARLIFKLTAGSNLGPQTELKLRGDDRECKLHFQRNFGDGIQLATPGVNLTPSDSGFTGGAVFGPVRALANQSAGMSAWRDGGTMVVGVVETASPEKVSPDEIRELAALAGTKAEQLAVVVTPSTGVIGMTQAPLRALGVLHSQLEAKSLVGDHVQLNHGDARIKWHSSLENGAAIHPTLLEEVVRNPDVGLELFLTLSNPPDAYMEGPFIKIDEMSATLHEALVSAVDGGGAQYLDRSIDEVQFPKVVMVFTIGNKYFSVDKSGEVKVS